MTPLTTESLERLAVLYATAAIAGDSKRMNEVGDELRRRDERESALVRATRDAASDIRNDLVSRAGLSAALAAYPEVPNG